MLPTGSMLSVAIYGYGGSEILPHLLWTIRNLGGDDLEVVVTQDFDGSSAESAAYQAICKQYGATHNPLQSHRHMVGCCHEAVNATHGDWILVCSEDVLLPRGLLGMLQRFLADNRGSEFLERVAGIFLFHYDRGDIDEMAQAGELGEVLRDFRCVGDFYATSPLDPAWWWHVCGHRLRNAAWTERTPPDLVGCCSNVHGSAFVVQRKYWDQIGGCDGINVRENDSVISFRLGQWTDGVIVRLPWLPAIAHYGAHSPNPPDRVGLWSNTIPLLVCAHGGAFDDKFGDVLESDCPQNALIDIERGLKLRAYSLQERFRREIAALDYSYARLE